MSGDPWENVTPNGFTRRIAVPNGWLYSVADALTFVPDVAEKTDAPEIAWTWRSAKSALGKLGPYLTCEVGYTPEGWFVKASGPNGIVDGERKPTAVEAQAEAEALAGRLWKWGWFSE